MVLMVKQQLLVTQNTLFVMRNLISTLLLVLFSCITLWAQTPAISYQPTNLREGNNAIYNNPANGKTLIALLRNGNIVSWQIMQGTKMLANFEPIPQASEPTPEPEPEPDPKPKPKPTPTLPPSGTKLEGTQKENIIEEQPSYKDVLSGAVIDTKCENGSCFILGDIALRLLQ